MTGHQDIEIAVGIVVSPLHLPMLYSQSVEDVLPGEDPIAVVAVAADKAVVIQRRNVDQQQIEIQVVVKVGPGALGMGGRGKDRVGFGEDPAAAAVGAVVAHQRRAVGKGGKIEDRRQQQVEIAVIVVVRPGNRAQVEIGLVVVLPIARELGIGQYQISGIVAVDDGGAVAAQCQILIAIPVHIAPGEVGSAGADAVQGHVGVAEFPLTRSRRPLIGDQHQAIFHTLIINHIIAEHRDIEVAVSVIVGRGGGDHPEILILRGHEKRIERGHLGEVPEGAARVGLHGDKAHRAAAVAVLIGDGQAHDVGVGIGVSMGRVLQRRAIAVAEIPVPTDDKAVGIHAGVGEVDRQPVGIEIEGGIGRPVERRGRRTGEIFDIALLAHCPGVAGRIGGDGGKSAEAGGTDVEHRPVLASGSRIVGGTGGGAQPQFIGADQVNIGKTIGIVGGGQHFPGRTAVIAAGGVAHPADGIAGALVEEIHIANLQEFAGEVALDPVRAVVGAAIITPTDIRRPAVGTFKINRDISATEVRYGCPGSATVAGMEQGIADAASADYPTVEKAGEMQIFGVEVGRGGGCGQPVAAAVAAGINAAGLVKRHHLLRPDNLHRLQVECGQCLVEDPGRGAVAGQEGAVIADRDQIAVRKAIEVVEALPGATGDLRPGGAAIGGLDDEAGTVAEVADLSIGKHRHCAAQEARLRSRRGEGLGPA